MVNNYGRTLLLTVAALLGASVLACSIEMGGAGPHKPSVEILSPPSGSRVALGEQVEVEYRAIDAVAVVRVELEVGQQIVDLQRSPTAEGQASLNGILRWTPTTPGVHTLLVYAYNRDGASNDGVGVQITVGEGTPTAVMPKPTTSPPSPTPTVPSWPVVFADDFDDPTSGFGESVDDTYLAFYDGGRYSIELLAEDWVGWSSLGQFSDFVAELDVISHGEAGGAGMIFRNQEDGRQFYLFAINVDGLYWLRMMTADGWQLIRDWQASPHIRTGAATNHLTVVCIGPNISLYVNGHYLETVQDSTYSEGEIGLLAGTSVGEPHALFSFDNLQVHGPTPVAVLFQDDFSDPSSGWSTGGGNEGEVRYDDGELHIRDYTTPDFPTVSRPGLNFGDLTMEVESRLLAGSENNWLGHYCRYVDSDNYYVMAYSSDGYYTGVGKLEGERTELVEPMRTDAIRQGTGATNVARLDCIGSSLRFWVNGELLIDITDGSLTEGDIGLDGESHDGEYTEVAFDNLVVRAP